MHTHIFYRVGLKTEKAMAPHSSTLAWKIPWMEESGRLQSIGSQRVGNDGATRSEEHTSELQSPRPISSTLARKIPWMEESGRLQSMGSLRVGHDD